MRVKKNTLLHIAAFAIPTGMVLVVLLIFGITLHRRNDTIQTLRKMLALQNDSEESQDPFFEPVPVDHNYELSGNKILLSDDVYGQIWIPVLKDVPLSTHPLENMRENERGRMISVDASGNENALTGIDLSAHNTVTDWNAVKADGIDFVMLRVGYRTYGGGKVQEDDKFLEFYHGAKQAGLKVGAYFFSQAVSEEEAIEEAVFTAEKLRNCELDFPVAYDWEIIYDDTARTDNVPVETLTSCILAYCENIQAFGWQPMIYQNKRTSLFKLDLPRLQEFPFWLAEYGDGPTYIYDYDMWQYSCTGRVNGIEGDVDLNLSFYDYAQPGAPAISTVQETTAAPAGTTVQQVQGSTP